MKSTFHDYPMVNFSNEINWILITMSRKSKPSNIIIYLYCMQQGQRKHNYVITYVSFHGKHNKTTRATGTQTRRDTKKIISVNIITNNDTFGDTEGDYYWDPARDNKMVIFTKVKQQHYGIIGQYKSDIGCLVQSSLGMLFHHCYVKTVM